MAVVVTTCAVVTLPVEGRVKGTDDVGQQTVERAAVVMVTFGDGTTVVTDPVGLSADMATSLITA